MRAWAGVAAFVAGCNPVFGIEETSLSIDAAPGTDEDGDNVVNDLDDCPGIYDPLQQDGDDDGVGDACDPHVATPGDKIIFTEFFEGMSFALTPGNAASWTLAGGMLVTAGPADATDAVVSVHKAAPEPTIEVGFTIEDYGSPMMFKTIDVTVAYPGNTGLCRLVSLHDGEPISEVVTQAQMGEQYTNIVPMPLAVGAPYAAQLTRNGTAMGQCLVSTTSTAVGLGPNSDHSDVTAAISIRYAKVALRYVLLYAVP